ncbi:MAG: 3-hydroxyacyl-CoA dehydrogenase family protein [Thermoleophilia bacterium]|nr:3-hydroxyacyl-CoA dehydrogenase family protein [Thermoleophilia bacterium]
MISRLAVIGSGVMGSEIAQVAAAAGCTVVLLDSDPSALERAREHIRGIGERRVAKNRLTAAEADEILGRIVLTGDDRELGECELAIEAVPEILEIKRAVFEKLDAKLPPGALLASNTSGLSITELARHTSRPEHVLGLHFFNPASVMRLVEVVQGESTGDEAVTAGEEFASAIGKTPVRVRECPGFLVNRILVRAMASAYDATGDDRAARAGADRAVAESGPAPMGPFALGDLIGLDTLEHLRTDLVGAYGSRFEDGGHTASLTDAGRLGRKSGGGFFDDRAPEVEINRSAEAVALTYYEAAADEASRCLAENIASRADIDLAMQLGCGWEFGPLEWSEKHPDPVERR